MSSATPRRRAFVMALVLIVMTVVGGALAVLAYFSADYYRTQQVDRIRQATRVIADSVADYARTQAPRWRDRQPSEPVSVDIASLLPAGAEGSAVITFPAGNEPGLCRVVVQVNRGRYQIADEIDVELSRAQASRPAATGAE